MLRADYFAELIALTNTRNRLVVFKFCIPLFALQYLSLSILTFHQTGPCFSNKNQYINY